MNLQISEGKTRISISVWGKEWQDKLITLLKDFKNEYDESLLLDLLAMISDQSEDGLPLLRVAPRHKNPLRHGTLNE